MGISDLSRIPEVAKSALSGKTCRLYRDPPPDSFADLPMASPDPPHRAYMKIADGCSHRCSFCIIPKIRGRYRSVPMETAVDQARHLSAMGVGELTLVAQDTTLYGMDLYGRPRLAELLQRLSSVEGIRWIRLMYAYPTSLSVDVLKTMATHKNICPYVDIPLQHSHGEVLRKMGRPHGTDPRAVIEKIRTYLPGAVIRTAFIVGHPGETGKRFEHLMDFVRESRFYHCGVFPYSPEEGTPSARFRTRPSGAEARRRADALMEVQQEISLQLRGELVGTTISAVCEEILDEETRAGEVMLDMNTGEISGLTNLPPGTIAIGRTINDAPEVDGLLFIKGPPPGPGSFFQCRVTGCTPYDTIGEVTDVQTP